MTEPADHESFPAHVREWFEKDVEPRLSALLEFAEANGRTMSGMLAVVQEFADAVAPQAAPEVAAVAGKLRDLAGKAAADLDHFLNR